MELKTSQQGRATIIELSGNFDIAAAKPFEAEVTSLMDSGKNRILLCFVDVPFIASTGLRMLLKSAQRAKNESGLLHICCINDTVKDVFHMTGFDTILSVFNTREEALEELV